MCATRGDKTVGEGFTGTFPELCAGMQAEEYSYLIEKSYTSRTKQETETLTARLFFETLAAIDDVTEEYVEKYQNTSRRREGLVVVGSESIYPILLRKTLKAVFGETDIRIALHVPPSDGATTLQGESVKLSQEGVRS